MERALESALPTVVPSVLETRRPLNVEYEIDYQVTILPITVLAGTGGWVPCGKEGGGGYGLDWVSGRKGGLGVGSGVGIDQSVAVSPFFVISCGIPVSPFCF